MLLTIKGSEAKAIESQPRKLGIAKVKIVSLVPQRFRMTPEITQDKAPPIGIIATTHENSASVTSKPFSALKILGPVGADQPSVIPYRIDPPFAAMHQSMKYNKVNYSK